MNQQPSILLLILSLFLSTSSLAQAQVILTEVYPNPSTGNEWVELHNKGTQAVSLEGWTLWDQLSTPSLLTTFTNQSLAAGEYLLVTVINKLNNGGDSLTLLNVTGQTQDSMSYASSAPDLSWVRSPESSQTWVQQSPSPGGSSSTPSPSPNPTASPTPTPSPSPTSSPTSTPTPSPTPSPTLSPTPPPELWLFLSEVMSCPLSGEAEWLELFNASNQVQTIQNWQIKDSVGSTRTISGTVPALGYGVISWGSSLLNNTGDAATITSQSGVIIGAAELEACSSGQSFIWQQSEWQLTTSATPGQPNQLSDLQTQPTPAPSPAPAATPWVLQPNLTPPAVTASEPNSVSKLPASSLASNLIGSANPGGLSSPLKSLVTKPFKLPYDISRIQLTPADLLLNHQSEFGPDSTSTELKNNSVNPPPIEFSPGSRSQRLGALSGILTGAVLALSGAARLIYFYYVQLPPQPLG